MEVGYNYKAVVRDIIDGDTIKVEVDLGFYIKVDIIIRLARINAYELRGDEYFKGLDSLKYLSSILRKGSEIILINRKWYW